MKVGCFDQPVCCCGGCRGDDIHVEESQEQCGSGLQVTGLYLVQCIVNVAGLPKQH